MPKLKKLQKYMKMYTPTPAMHFLLNCNPTKSILYPSGIECIIVEVSYDNGNF